MLGAFFDDSGTHDGSQVVAIGGLLGTDHQWDVFEQGWNEVLKAPLPGRPPLKHFHLTECRNGTGDFRGFSQAERDHLTYRFRQVILTTGMVTVAVAVDKVVWDELITEELGEHYETALGFCFFKCIEEVTNIIRARRPGEPIDMYFDAGTEDRLGEFARRFRDVRPFMWREIECLSFAPVKRVVALQGADMVAYETYTYAIESLRNPDNPTVLAHFKDFIYRELTIGLLAVRGHIEEIVSRIRETIDKTA
ncbi:DUF3800 domain-containing protein [Tardiphaga sp. 619_E2_N8_5]|uniref:DUF3800 domain-containing protein n=1 Tax=unclassified Tardiphaga TaxID=2631404 RepID=UPI003F265D11